MIGVPTTDPQVSLCGCLADEDLARIPEPMVEAVGILRRIAHCGMPLATRGTLKVLCSLREPGYHPMYATIYQDGTMRFRCF